jgi:beta-lactamase class A
MVTDTTISNRNGLFTRRAALGYVAAGMAGARLPLVAAAQDATPAANAPNWDAVDRLVAAAAPDAALLAVELVDDEIAPVHRFNADQILPIGSSFKLWILGTLAEQVEAGTLDWEQLVEIDDRYRSVPGGDLRYVDIGTPFTLRYLAERMIQKSDNTATDHMLFTAGRENVEGMMATMGVAEPGRNVPLISTRELAMLKFAYPTDKLDTYYASGVDERRRILAEEIEAIPYEALADIEQSAPLEIDRVEWFATRDDLARTMAWLHRASQRTELRPVAEIMALETQLPFDGETWPYVGFKGGSELGVLSGTWLMQRADGRHFVLSLGFRNPDGEVTMPVAVAAMEAGREALAETP